MSTRGQSPKRVDGDPAPEKLLNAINAALFDLGGVVPSDGPDKSLGSHRVLFTMRLIKIAGQ